MRGGKGSVFISVNRQRGELLGIEREREGCAPHIGLGMSRGVPIIERGGREIAE